MDTDTYMRQNGKTFFGTSHDPGNSRMRTVCVSKSIPAWKFDKQGGFSKTNKVSHFQGPDMIWSDKGV